MIACICLSPAIQRTFVCTEFAQGEINRANEVYLDAAGKGLNVARTLVQMGHKAVHVSQGGSNAADFSSCVGFDSISLEMVNHSGPIRTCTTVVSLNSEGIVSHVTELVEPSSPVETDTVNGIIDRAGSVFRQAQGLVLSGSFASGFHPEIAATLTQMAKKAGIRVVLDIRDEALLMALKEEPDIVKINISEFAKTFMPETALLIEQQELKGGTDHLDGIYETLKDITEDMTTTVIITRGPRPLISARQGRVGTLQIPRISHTQIVNPTGSGDAFSAGLISTMVRNKNWDETVLAEAVDLGVTCGQSNARTLRPGYMDEEFLQRYRSA